ncbi:MAG TPA: N-acetylmuramoyl-L-alanine amidase [Candidatus Saccharimonadales bacterium]|nr:N-acetylmuramoyl-L-alanine amidase [Candidatus Saccharimonadales bacterium]
MKLFVSLGLLWVTVLAAFAHSASAALERIAIGGSEYVRLEDWARANRFQIKSTKQDIRIFNHEFSAIFAPDSRKATINDISVWLSAPIAFRNGSTLIPPVDVSTALQPLLNPSKNSPGKKVTTICIDPGHGGKDPGNREGRQLEKAYTLLLARELSNQLTKAGFKVSLTRSGDDFVDLNARPEKAKAKRADLFVSLHFNSANGVGTSQVTGTEVYCLTPARTSSTNAGGEGSNTGSYPGNRFDSKNMLLAYQVQKTLLKNLSTEDRGVRRARFAVLRTAEMPAILIEGGFMSNKTEAKKIYDPTYRRQMAQAITEGVVNYKRMVE